MTAVTTLPWGRPLTEDDLGRLPDDGHRYELLDGTLIVTPAPSAAHQACVLAVYRLLHEAARSDAVVLVAPFDVKPSPGTVLQPDVFVARKRDVSARDIRRPLLLAVEVRSPSTASIDLGAKMLAYARAGIPAYWVVDPDEPSIAVFELVEGRYADAGTARGDESIDVVLPYPVTVCPARLLDALR